MKHQTINLGDNHDPVAYQLGNFAPARFWIDRVYCRSAEGYIQSLKFADPDKQREVCRMVGVRAKFAGKKAGKRIAREGTVFWQGESVLFGSDQHQRWIELGIEAKFRQDFDSQFDLISTGDQSLIHDTGHPESRFTSLPSSAFVTTVSQIRLNLISEAIDVTDAGPHSILSNLADTPFTYNGRLFGSVEGFIQSLKFPLGQQRKQIEILAGAAIRDVALRMMGISEMRDAKTGVLFGLTPEGEQTAFRSAKHIWLIQAAMRAKFTQNPTAMNILCSTRTRPLFCKFKIDLFSDAALTPKEFCGTLNQIRNNEKSLR